MSSFSRLYLRKRGGPNDRVWMRCETATPPSPDPEASAGDVCVVKDGASSTVLQYDGSSWSAIGGSPGSTLGYFDPAVAPASGHASDVEYSGGSVAGTTVWDPATNGITQTAVNGKNRILIPHDASVEWGGVYKAAPSGSWSAWTRMGMTSSRGATNVAMGIAVWGETPGATSDFHFMYRSAADGTSAFSDVTVQRYTSYTTFSSTDAQMLRFPPSSGQEWFRVRWASGATRISFDHSMDGVCWHQVFSTATPFVTPTHVGIVGLNNAGSASPMYILADFIRFNTDTDVFKIPDGQSV